VAFRAEIDDFAAFYATTYQRAYRTALGIVGDPASADDVTQDAFVAAYLARHRFRGDAPAEAWLVRIVVNRAISFTRRRRVVWMEPLDERTGSRDDGSERVVGRLSLVAALGRLPADQRAAIVLRYYLDYDYETIARVLDAKVGTVGSWLHRGLLALATALAEPAERIRRDGTADGDRS
jgi:RNA polymerase sigma-70 factor (ECF subfamily)